jgi:hypothetical protein
MKNVNLMKKAAPSTVAFLLLFLTISLLLIQTSSVSAQESEASLTGIISDEALDTNDDGAYDKLLIGVEVNVTTAGTFTIEVVKLYDESYNLVNVTSQNSTFLDIGVHTVQVLLDGSTIYLSGLVPDTVAIIVLYDESGTKIDEQFDILLSQSYSFVDFVPISSEINYDQIQRKIFLEQSGKIYVSNVYTVTNLDILRTTVDIDFPEDAHNFRVRDEMGILETTTENETLTITLRNNIYTNETIKLHVIYDLQWENYVTFQNGKDYTLSFLFFDQLNSSIETVEISIILPIGAKFQSSELNPETIQEKDNQETLLFYFSEVTPSENLEFKINYEYNVFWASFYPTIWVGIVVVIGSVLFCFWGTPKTITVPSIQVPPKDLRSFVDTYEEKTAIQSEIESLDERLKKGKIPRRRYKVRKKMLDGRLSTICRNLQTLRGSIGASSSAYASLMHQLEVAEAKIEGAQKDIKRVKSKYRRGETSKSAYRQLLEEYRNQIEEARATIEGVLLRLHD